MKTLKEIIEWARGLYEHPGFDDLRVYWWIRTKTYLNKKDQELIKTMQVMIKNGDTTNTILTVLKREFPDRITIKSYKYRKQEGPQKDLFEGT